MDDGRLRSILAELRARLERIYGPRLLKLVLYGSQARGDAEDGSDIDVLVVLHGPVDPGLEIARTEFDVAKVSLVYGVAVTCFFVSLEQFDHEQSPLLMNARREGVTV
jgi:predicted nucleotidyltransferase